MFANGFWKMPATGLLAFVVACGGDEGATGGATQNEVATPGTAVQPAQPAPDQTVAPDPGGEVIEIRMVMPGGTNPAYEPAQIAANPGDVLRFINVENVHNVHFPQNINPAGVNLPPPSPYLTQPGQTYELKVDFVPGTYEFICDPHAAQGMVGELTVTQ